MIEPRRRSIMEGSTARGEEVHSLHIHRPEPLQILGRGGENRADVADARVVHQHVAAAVLARTRSNERFATRLVGDIRRRGKRASAGSC